MQTTVDATTPRTSTILAGNIHCASCVTYIYGLLAPYSHAIRDIEVSVVTGEVHIVHDQTISVGEICKLLEDGAFEVHSATSKIVGAATGEEYRTHQSNSRPLWAQILGSYSSDPRCLELPRKRKHKENCEVCKKEAEADKIMKAQDDKMQNVDMEQVGELQNPERINSSARYKRKAILSIGGMTCASCTGSIEAGLRELPFIHSIEVALMTNSATVVYDGAENLNDIEQAVEDIGFDCTIESDGAIQEASKEKQSDDQSRTIVLRIDGMYCKHCPWKITSGLDKVYGSTIKMDSTFGLSSPLLHVSYKPEIPHFTIRSIVNTIIDIDPAFKTSLYRPAPEERSQEMQRRESYRLLLRILFTFSIAIPTFLIGVAWMSLVPASNSVRRFFEEPTWAGSVARRDWALLILATPVMFYGADVFHTRALKEIRSLWRRSSRVPILRRFYRFGSMNLLVSAGTSVAYFSSIAILIIAGTSRSEGMMSHSQTYFDTVVFLTFFILIGRWLEAYSKAKTGNAVALLGGLKPSEALLIESDLRPTSIATSVSGNIEKHITDPGKQVITPIDAFLLEAGDVVSVRHGTSPPADGVVVSGSTQFNESSLTGEARPIQKHKGDEVFAGSINIGSVIEVRVTDVGNTSMLDQIVSVVREGQTKRAPVERVVDVVTAYFVPIITALAILTWLIWLTLGETGALDIKYLRSTQQGGWPFWSLEFAIAVFVVACPCGIGLAAPTALFVGSGLAAKHGILARGGGEAFQEASSVDAVVFDKTGTLTVGGDLTVTDHEVLVKDEEVALAWLFAKALEEASTHPLARAILRLSSSQSPDDTLSTMEITEKAGKGLQSKVSSSRGEYEAALGSEAFIQSLLPSDDNDYFADATTSKWKAQAKSVAVLAIRSCSESVWRVAIMFAIADPIRPSTIPTLQALENRNIPVYMLTGDNPITAAAVATTIGIPSHHVFAGVLPVEKAEKIKWLQSNVPKRTPPSIISKWLPTRLSSSTLKARSRNSSQRREKATIAFLGDGINDAPALTAASVSIALAHPSASDIALTSSSFILLSSPSSSPPPPSSNPTTHNIEGANTPTTDHLSTLLTLLTLSTRIFNRVKLNFAWAVVYNAILVPVAAGVLFRVREEGWRLGPVWGSAAMAASSVSVVLSSLALRWESWGQLGGWRGKGKGKGGR